MRPRILIGPVSEDRRESVSTVNRAFAQGLADRYEFLSLNATRSYGETRQSAFNAVNLLYFGQQCLRWCWSLLSGRPSLAHYAISTGFAMEKGLIFMRLARLFGAKTLGHCHSGGFSDHWRGLSPRRRSWALRQFHQLDGLVLASEGWRQEFIRLMDLPPDRLHVVNNPIDAEFERKARRLDAARNADGVLALGIMSKAKGIEDILAAATEVGKTQPLRLALVGGERQPGVHQLIRNHIAAHNLHDCVSLHANVDEEAKFALYERSGILVLPSHFENLPLVLIEAAAAGMAIITTPVGAVPEIFTDGETALFVEVGNSVQLADAISRLLRNPSERLRLAQAARALFLSRLARETIIASLDEVYQRVIPAPSGR